MLNRLNKHRIISKKGKKLLKEPITGTMSKFPIIS